jgi:HlyD family secretion protein
MVNRLIYWSRRKQMEIKTKKNRSLWIIGGLALLAAAALFFGFNRRAQSQGSTTSEFGEIVVAFIGDLSASAATSGQVLPRRDANLAVATPGLVEQVFVRVGDTVQAGDALLRVEATDLALNVAAAEQNLLLEEASLAGLLEEPSAAEIASAEVAVASAQASLDDLLDGSPTLELAASEANVRLAEASLRSASASLATVNDTIGAAQIKAAEAALLAAQINQRNAQEVNAENPNQATHDAMLEANQALAEAQAQLDSLLAGPDQGQLGAAQGSVTSAEASLEASRANLAIQVSGATPAQIAASESQLAQAQATLAGLLEGATQEQIQAAEARVEQARLSLMDARDALDKATLLSPFAGMVTAVHVSQGEFASGPVIELVDMETLQVILEVDEVDIGALSIGQPASITLETWPDVEIEGSITTIAPRAESSLGSGLVTYQVHLDLEPTDLPIRIGMTANANLTIADKQGVLLVPNKAINVDRQAGTYSVSLVVGDSVQEVEVTVGLHDSQHSEILNGLNPGDKLLVDNAIPTVMDEMESRGGMFGGN